MRVGLIAATIEVGTSTVEITRAKERGLLALLALSPGRIVTVDRLIDGLWGDAPPKTAAKTLQTYVKNLRGRLVEAGSTRDTLRTEPPGYLLLIDDVDVDVLRFERLCGQAVTASAAGDPAEADRLLHDALNIVGNGDFATFDAPGLEGPRRRLIEQHRRARDARADAQLALGRHQDVIGHLAELVEHEPENERAWAQLMTALYRSNRQRDALQVFTVARAQLAADFGLDPGPALVLLEQQILTHTLPAYSDSVSAARDTPEDDRDTTGVTVTLLRGPDSSAPVKSEHVPLGLDGIGRLVVERIGVVDHYPTADGYQIQVHHAADAALIITRALERSSHVRAIAHPSDASSAEVEALVVSLDGGTTRAMFAAEAGADLARYGWTKAATGWIPGERQRSPRLPPAVVRHLDEHPLRIERDVASHSSSIVSSIAAGGRRLIQISGPMGIGKSHWFADFAELASRHGAVVLAASGGGSHAANHTTIAELGYQAVLQLPVLELERHLERFGNVLAQTVPELASRVGYRPADGNEQEHSSQVVNAALLDLIHRLCTSIPVVLLVDDAPMLDDASARSLVQLIQDPSARSIAVALACRTGDSTQSPLDSGLEHTCLTEASRITLEPFSFDETTRYLEHLAEGTRTPRTAAVAAIVHGVTKGLPLFVREVAHELRSSVEWFSPDGKWQIDRVIDDFAMPPSIRELLGIRLERLPASTRQLASTAAVLGETFGYELLAHVSDTALADVLVMTDTLLYERIVEEVPGLGDYYRFTHPLVREAAQAQIGAGRQRSLAMAAARKLGEQPTPTAAQLDQIADLSYRSLPLAAPAVVSGHLLCAASAARSRGDYRQALAHFGRLGSLERETGGASANTAVSIAEMSAKADAEAGVTRALARQAYALALEQKDESLVARAALAFMGPFNPFGALVSVDNEAETMARAALALEPADKQQRAHLLGMLTAARSDVHGAAPELEAAMIAAHEAGDPVLHGQMLSLRNAIESTLTPVLERLSIDDEIISIGTLASDRDLVMQGWGWTSAHAFEAGDCALMEKAANERAHLAELLGDRVYQWSDRVYQGMRLTIAGRFDAAEAMLWHALEVGRLPLGEHANRFFGLQLLKLAEMRGQGGTILEPTAQFAAQLDYVSSYVALAHLCSEMGDFERASDLIKQHVPEMLSDLPNTYDRIPTLAQLARIAQHTGDGDLGARVFAELRPHQPELCVHADAVLYGSVRHNLGRCALVMSEPAQALAHFDDAVAPYERLQANAWSLLLDSDRAAALEAIGQKGAAASLLLATQDRATEMGLAL